jgi:serine/threonine protein kinase
VLLTLTEIGYGAVGIVYRAAEGCIVKLSQSPDKAEELLAEARIYRILQSSNVSCFIPTLFGVFRHDQTVALVLSDEGRPIIRFDELSLTDRYVHKGPSLTPLLMTWRLHRKLLYMVLFRVHENGVLHGDFRPLNVLYSPRGPVLIDFSHSRADHLCPSGSACPELEFAKSQLSLKNADTVNTGALTTVDFYALFRSLPAGFRIAQCRGMVHTVVCIVGTLVAFSLIS